MCVRIWICTYLGWLICLTGGGRFSFEAKDISLLTMPPPPLSDHIFASFRVGRLVRPPAPPVNPAAPTSVRARLRPMRSALATETVGLFAADVAADGAAVGPTDFGAPCTGDAATLGPPMLSACDICPPRAGVEMPACDTLLAELLCKPAWLNALVDAPLPLRPMTVFSQPVRLARVMLGPLGEMCVSERSLVSVGLVEASVTSTGSTKRLGGWLAVEWEEPWPEVSERAGLFCEPCMWPLHTHTHTRCHHMHTLTLYQCDSHAHEVEPRRDKWVIWDSWPCMGRCVKLEHRRDLSVALDKWPCMGGCMKV